MINKEHTKKLLIDVLSVPTHSIREERMREYLIEYAINNNIKYHVDNKGNVYFTKGEVNGDENYPCVVSHIDTVHNNQTDLIDTDLKLSIVEPVEDVLIAIDPLTYKQTGIGGDDKCGVAICLTILEKVDVIKVAFFVEEEIGMNGSTEADWDFLSDCAYFIQFDAPFDNWVSKTCMGTRLFNDEFLEQIRPVLQSYEQTKISNDPFTDVLMLRKDGEVNCINFFAGYHRMHTSTEFVIPTQVFKAIELGCDVINVLGLKRSLYEKCVTENI